MSPQEFNQFRIQHYTDRLKDATSIDEIKFLQNYLDTLKGKVTTIVFGIGNMN